MSWMLLQVYHEIVENAAFGAVMACDVIICFLKLEWSFARQSQQSPQGMSHGPLVGMPRKAPLQLQEADDDIASHHSAESGVLYDFMVHLQQHPGHRITSL